MFKWLRYAAMDLELTEILDEHQMAKVILLDERRRLNIESDADLSIEDE